MKLNWILAGVLAFSLVSCNNKEGGDNHSSNNVEIKTEMDSVSYAIGANISESLLKQGIEGLNVDLLVKGIKDNHNKTLVVPAEVNSKVLEAYSMRQQAKYQEQMKAEAEAAKASAAPLIKEGKKFLEENGKRPEVTTLPSGLQYEIIKEGKGEKPTLNSVVKVHYHGTLIDGTVFDSSVERGEPATFPVGGVIKGWTEALQLMPVGSKWKLYIPYDLAYGEMGAGGKIKPYSTLVFDVELLDIEDK